MHIMLHLITADVIILDGNRTWKQLMPKYWLVPVTVSGDKKDHAILAQCVILSHKIFA